MKESMRGGNSFAFLCHDINELEHSRQVNLPRVTVGMPLKGFGEHNLHNWRSQVSLASTFIELSSLCAREEDCTQQLFLIHIFCSSESGKLKQISLNNY